MTKFAQSLADNLGPAQRTAVTARIVLTAGACASLEAVWNGSVARVVLAAIVLAFSGGLLAYAKRN